MDSTDSQYDAALGLLRSTSTWCKGAELLAALGDARAIIPLLQAYEQPAESPKVCLLRAMRNLGAARVADALAQESDPERRRMGLHLMELFSDDAHLAILERAVEDPNPEVKLQARRALRTQNQTEPWEATMIRLLQSSDQAVREDAISTLGSHRTPTALAALARHRDREPDPRLRSAIDLVAPA